MTDRELLELAAKAVGYGLPGPEDTDEIGRQYGDHLGLWAKFPWGFAWWSPLTDDGDALRLAVKLRMDVKQWNSLVIAVKAWNSHAEENTFTQCPYAATRRAIVRAAAEIGKATP